MSNPITTSFVDAMRQRYPIEGTSMGYADWISANTSLNRKPFSFKEYEFQKKITDDMHPDMAVIKISQVGLTEVQNRKALAFCARNRGVSVIFSLPNERMFKRVSKTRIGPLIKSEKVFSRSAYDDKPLQSMDLYEVNGSFLYCTGMVEGDATSIPADMLMHDELDLSDPQIIALYQSRLQNSKWRITQSFSTPSHPGFGIDGLYKTSDSHEYMCRCQRCGHWQVPLFTPRFIRSPDLPEVKSFLDLPQDVLDILDPSEIKLVCEKCERPLDISDPTSREWVAEYPARNRRGYRIRPFSTVRLPPAYVFSSLSKYKLSDNVKGFSCTVLGEAYSDGSNQLDEQMVRRCFDSENEEELGNAPLAIGIDVGRTCHLVLGRIKGNVAHPVRWMVCRDSDLEETVKTLFSQYNIVCGSVDRFPYTPTAHNLSRQTNKVILPVQYRGTQVIQLINDEFDQLSHASADRTHIIDAVTGLVRRGEMRMSGYGAHKQTIIAHLQDMVRIEVEGKPATWTKLTGNDHFLHALAFMQAAITLHQVISLNSVQDFSPTMVMLESLDAEEKSLPDLNFRNKQSLRSPFKGSR